MRLGRRVDEQEGWPVGNEIGWETRNVGRECDDM